MIGAYITAKGRKEEALKGVHEAIHAAIIARACMTLLADYERRWRGEAFSLTPPEISRDFGKALEEARDDLIDIEAGAF